MSLKAIHLVFIISSILISLGFGVWSYVTNQREPASIHQIYMIGSGVMAVVLVVYGIFFLRKLRNESYL